MQPIITPRTSVRPSTTGQPPAGPAETAAPHAEPDTGRRVLLAPITVTPSKPLTPSHLKGLLWTDVMHRATRPLAEVTHRCSHTTYHPTE
ncbi:hypothetical protein [Streptomyces sp. NPDC018347]|uniref:hypothetical protein n=1 Tax=Streptomyces sp. NPDC018347 TaxID=3157193 RepID=UPI0033D4ADCD